MPEIILSGPVGRLEARIHHSKDKYAPVALVLHPNPQHGGTMNSKVVYNLYSCFANNGFTVLRFNFRGVGRSLGEYGKGEGELHDATSVLDWLQNNNTYCREFWVAGFSFGAWIAMQLLMRRPEISNFIAISPPIKKYDFGFLAPCPVPGLVVQGDMDSIVAEENVYNFIQDLRNQQSNLALDYNVINGADHFFRMKEQELKSILNKYIAKIRRGS